MALVLDPTSDPTSDPADHHAGRRGARVIRRAGGAAGVRPHHAELVASVMGARHRRERRGREPAGAGPRACATFATLVWCIACCLLVVIAAPPPRTGPGTPARAASHHRDPVMAHFYGAPPMALLTVGAGALLVGRRVIGAGGRGRRLGALDRRHAARAWSAPSRSPS